MDAVQKKQAITVEHDRQEIDIVQELAGLRADSWEYATVTGEEFERNLQYLISARTSEDMVARKYVFAIEIDKLSATRVGEVSLQVFDSYDDNWKPVDTLLASFDGIIAETLFQSIDKTSPGGSINEELSLPPIGERED